jgi:NAD(P)H-dependent FMN reductase
MNLPPARVWVYRKPDEDKSVCRIVLSSDIDHAAPKILVIPGSLRTGSHNARLAALAAKELALAEAEVTRISLEDYPLPLFDADLAAAVPAAAAGGAAQAMLMAHQGVFITSPEYSASVTPLLKNTIDWISRVRDRGEPTYAAVQGPRLCHRLRRRAARPAACAR